jgi:Tfp pilus assembly protein PilF
VTRRLHRGGLRLGVAAAALVFSLSGCASKDKKPQSAELMLNERMAAVLLRDGQCADAERAFQEAVKNDPKKPELYDGLGVAQLCQSKIGPSIDALDRAVKMSPNKAAFRIQRACAHTEAGHYTLAEEDFKAAEANSTAAEDRLEIAINRGRLRQREGNYPAAESEFSEALSMDPQSVPALMGRGMAREASGNTSHAAEDYLEAVRLQPKNPEANLRLGVSLMTLKKYALGKRYLERTVELDPVGEVGAKARVMLDKPPSS